MSLFETKYFRFKFRRYLQIATELETNLVISNLLLSCSVRMSEGELQEVRDELRVVHVDLLEARDGLQSTQYELQTVRDELLTSQGELRESKQELRATNDDLRDKIALLDESRRETSEAISSAERLTEECRGLRGDLHQ